MSTRHRRLPIMVAASNRRWTGPGNKRTLTIGGAAPRLMAYAPGETSSTTERRVQAGPVRGSPWGFSVWPIRAMQSLDFAFMPDRRNRRQIRDFDHLGTPACQPDERSTPLVRQSA